MSFLTFSALLGHRQGEKPAAGVLGGGLRSLGGGAIPLALVLAILAILAVLAIVADGSRAHGAGGSREEDRSTHYNKTR